MRDFLIKSGDMMEIERPLEEPLLQKVDLKEASEANPCTSPPPASNNSSADPIDNSVSSTVSSNEPEQEPLEDIPEDGGAAVEEPKVEADLAAASAVDVVDQSSLSLISVAEPSTDAVKVDVKVPDVEIVKEEILEVNGKPENVPDVEPMGVENVPEEVSLKVEDTVIHAFD